MIERWSNEPGQTVLDEIMLPDPVAAWLGENHPTYPKGPWCVCIHWRSTGYRDSGSMYGGPQNLGWPPEGDDERTLDFVEVDGVRLPQELAELVFETHSEAVDATEDD